MGQGCMERSGMYPLHPNVMLSQAQYFVKLFLLPYLHLDYSYCFCKIHLFYEGVKYLCLF